MEYRGAGPASDRGLDHVREPRDSDPAGPGQTMPHIVPPGLGLPAGTAGRPITDDAAVLFVCMDPGDALARRHAATHPKRHPSEQLSAAADRADPAFRTAAPHRTEPAAAGRFPAIYVLLMQAERPGVRHQRQRPLSEIAEATAAAARPSLSACLPGRRCTPPPQMPHRPAPKLTSPQLPNGARSPSVGAAAPPSTSLRGRAAGSSTSAPGPQAQRRLDAEALLHSGPPSHIPFRDMYVHKTPPNSPQSTPFLA